jgi:hypothetical protein
MQVRSVAALAVSVSVAGCGSTAHGSSSASSAKPAAQPSPYAGLGATRAAFDAGHSTSRGPEPIQESTSYTLVHVNPTDRVISFQITVERTPPLSDRERLDLLAGIGLPVDAAKIAQSGSYCEVWRSETLSHLIGVAYARGTTVPGTTSADIHTTTTPRC